jgi:acetyl esterase/lipase
MRKLALTALLVASQVMSDPNVLTAQAADNAVVPGTSDAAQPRSMPLLEATSTIGDILDNPAFAGFAQLILPWDGRTYDRTMHLTDIGTLLPYHSLVDTGTVVDSLNRLVQDVSNGRTVYYDIYDEAAKRADPTKRNTGLFFVRGRLDAPFAIIAPGGGFAYVGSVHEGFPYAAAISDKGYNAFVLRYRAGMGGRIATEDLAAAIGFVFAHARQLGVDTKGYSLWGSSAGARMVASIGSHGVAAFDGPEHPKPEAIIIAYTSHSDRSDDEPRTFAVVGGDDAIAPPENMERRVEALRSLGTEVEFRVYPALPHGFGAGTGTVADGWVSDAVDFWAGR